jgi:hypothetical protein
MDNYVLKDAINEASINRYGTEATGEFIRKVLEKCNDQDLDDIDNKYAKLITKILEQGGKEKMKSEFIARLVTHILKYQQWPDQGHCLVCGGMYPADQHKNSEYSCKHHNYTEIYFNMVHEQPKVNNPAFEKLLKAVKSRLETYEVKDPGF